MLERLLHAAQIADVVVDDADHGSSINPGPDLEHPLRARDAAHARIAAHRLLDGPGDALEDRLDEMMRFARVEHLDVEGQPGFLAKARRNSTVSWAGKSPALSRFRLKPFGARQTRRGGR